MRFCPSRRTTTFARALFSATMPREHPPHGGAVHDRPRTTRFVRQGGQWTSRLGPVNKSAHRRRVRPGSTPLSSPSPRSDKTPRRHPRSSCPRTWPTAWRTLEDRTDRVFCRKPDRDIVLPQAWVFCGRRWLLWDGRGRSGRHLKRGVPSVLAPCTGRCLTGATQPHSNARQFAKHKKGLLRSSWPPT